MPTKKKTTAATPSTPAPAGAPNPADVSRTTGIADIPANSVAPLVGDPKPGYKTTEFWITAIVGTCVYVLPVFNIHIVDPQHTAEQVVAEVAGALPIVAYIYSRLKLKKILP